MNFLNAVKTYLTGSGIPVVSLFSSSDEVKPKSNDERSKNIEKAFKLGIFSLPVFFFNEIMEGLKVTNPQLDDFQLASVAYFSMLAAQPAPTAEYTTYYLNGNNADDIVAANEQSWLGLEKAVYERSTTEKKAIFYSKHLLGLSEGDAQTSYYNNLSRLQIWISNNGLWDGINTTLMEQKRKLAGIRAGIDASNQAAAKALAMSQINAEMTEEARIEAAQREAEAKATLEKNLNREAELDRQLNNIENGLPAYYGFIDTKNYIPYIIAGGALLYWLGTRRGKK